MYKLKQIHVRLESVHMIETGWWVLHGLTAAWFWMVYPDIPHCPVTSRWLLRGAGQRRCKKGCYHSCSEVLLVWSIWTVTDPDVKRNLWAENTKHCGELAFTPDVQTRVCSPSRTKGNPLFQRMTEKLETVTGKEPPTQMTMGPVTAEHQNS